MNKRQKKKNMTLKRKYKNLRIKGKIINNLAHWNSYAVTLNEKAGKCLVDIFIDKLLSHNK